MEINSTHMTFNWSPVFSTCNAIHYHVTPSNCGHCANVTNSTTVTCHSNIGPFRNNQQLCRFAVRSVVCDNIVGDENRRVQVTLRSKLSYLLLSLSALIMVDKLDCSQCSSQCSSDQCHPSVFTQNKKTDYTENTIQ